MPKKQNIFRRFFSFSGKMRIGEFWSELGTELIWAVCGMICLVLVLSVVITGDTQRVLDAVDVAVPIYGCLVLVRLAALSRRRLRDAGYGIRAYLWLLVPVAGPVVLVLLLCGKSAPDNKIKTGL